MSDLFVEPAYEDRSLGDVLPAVARALGVDAGLPPTSIELPEASALRRLPRRRARLRAAARPRRAGAVPALAARRPRPRHGRRPVDDRHQPDLAGHRADAGHPRRRRVHLAHPRHRRPAQRAHVEQVRRSSPSGSRTRPPSQRLVQAGVTTTVVNKREFADSGLTVAGQRGADFVGADRIGERMAAVLESTKSGPALAYMYDGDLDWTGHRYGVDSISWQLQLSMVDAAAEQLRETLPADVRILVVADHGMVDSPDREPARHRRPPRAAGRPRAARRRGALPPPLLPGRRRRRRGRRLAVRRRGPGRGAHPRRRDSSAAGSVRWRPPYARGSGTSWSPRATTSR